MMPAELDLDINPGLFETLRSGRFSSVCGGLPAEGATASFFISRHSFLAIKSRLVRLIRSCRTPETGLGIQLGNHDK